MLLELKKRGVLLVLASKNEEADVWDVFDRHPDMVLRRGDIAGYRINWKEKSSNLRELAEELNLGLDSFVFIDDSPVERLEVETNAPMVTVVPMPKEPARYAETLSKLWCFDSASITVEDTMRTQFMAQEQQRRESQENAISLQSYLESLQLVVEIQAAQEIDLARVAQLTQKTNQFNLSLIRRSLTEIREIHKSGTILVLNVKDRFGDYGLVGVAILKPENGCMLLDTFLISCRILGRGVEQAFLCTLFDFAYHKNLKAILAPYRSGSRNGQVKTFLLKMGFSQNQSDVLEAEVANAPKKPGHVKMQVGVLV
jgi:FkbH-like protein